MTWIVELDGDRRSLRDLEEGFRGQMPVILVDENYRLDPLLFVAVDDYGTVKTLARQEVDYLNVYIRIFLPGRQKIAMGHISREELGKPKVTYASLQDALVVSAALVGFKLGDDEAIILEPDRGPGPQAWRTLVQAEPVVEDVFKYLQESLNDWSNLGRIIEAIEHDLGGRDSLVATGWVDARSIKAFHATANNPLAAGVTARHGARKYDAPRTPMEPYDARNMVLIVTRKWIAAKSGRYISSCDE